MTYVPKNIIRNVTQYRTKFENKVSYDEKRYPLCDALQRRSEVKRYADPVTVFSIAWSQDGHPLAKENWDKFYTNWERIE